MASSSAIRAASSSSLQHSFCQTMPQQSLPLSGGRLWTFRLPGCCPRRRHSGPKPAAERCGVRAIQSNEDKQEPPWQRLQKAASKANTDSSSLAEKLGENAKVVLGDATPDEEWRRIDAKVHKYPTARFFTSIGTGDDDFAKSMVTAVESIIGTLPEERVVQRYSEQRRYISVKIGPIMCTSSDQVVAIYQAMRADPRMRFFI